MTGRSVLDRSAFPVLVVAGAERERLAGETLRRILAELGALGHDIVRSSSITDAAALVASDPSFGCLLLDWNLEHEGGGRPALAVFDQVRRHNVRVPVFLMVEHDDLDDIPLAVQEAVQEFVLVFEDTPSFVAGRIDYAWRRHTENLLPPFFRTLVDFTESHEYSWHTPGHAGGTAFRKSQVGKAFYDFYGETLFRTDLSVSVAELGSLLDHSGVVGEAERNAARVFGADATYFVLNGTSTSNQIVAHACVVAGDVVLADRNCHKSVNYALTVTGAVPVYLMPSRNGYGLIGPISADGLTPEAVADAVSASPLAAGAASKAPVYAVVTNSTYDGLCYRADRVVELLGQSTPRVHFDEAWFAYARFHPLYASRYAMHESTPRAGDPTVFATQSTHKLLAAFSQASMIHIRSSERAPVEPSRFNEAYMMHGSTSPFYPMIACLDVATAMMDGPGGLSLVEDAIREAVRFRKRIVTLALKLAESPDGQAPWFFGVWQPEEVRDPASDKVLPFARGARRTARERTFVLGTGARPVMARLRRARAGLLHARSGQGHAHDPRRRRGGQSRRDGDPRPGRLQLPRQPSRRGRKDGRLQPARALLHRHDERQVGHAARRPARLQARLRLGTLSWGGHRGAGRRLPGPLRQDDLA